MVEVAVVKYKVCFLSGSTSRSARKIATDVRSALNSLGVRVHSADEISLGDAIGESLTDAVLSADFVCIVISDSKPSPAVMYEAGIAAGSRRPVVVVADFRVADNVSTQLISGSLIRYKPDSGSLLLENLRAYVQQVQPLADRLEWRKSSYDSPSRSSQPRSLDESSVVAERVAARLETAGALVTREAHLLGNLQPDIIATFPTLGPEFNPVIVEIKSAPAYRDRADAAISQVRDYLRAADARLGLIVYDSGDRPLVANINGPLGILLLSLSDLNAWNNERLLGEINKLRNEVVHSA